MQILVYPIQLFIIPYLINSLGIESYGNYVFSLAVIGIIIPLIDFGTSISLQVGFSVLDKKSKQKKISELIGFKLIIASTVTTLFFFLILFFNLFSWNIFCLGGWVIYAIFSCDFYYLAELKNKKLFIRQLIQKVVFFVFVFPFVFLFNSVETVFLCLSLSYIIVAYFTFNDLKKYGFHLYPIFSTKSIVKNFKINLLYFINNIATAGFASINTYFIDYNLGSKAVGKFSVLESLNRACLSLVSSLNSVLFPMLSKKMNKKYFIAGFTILPIYIIISFIIYYNKKLIFQFFKIDHFDDSTLIIMLTILSLDALSKFLGYNFLGSIGKGNIVNISNIIGLCSYLPVYFLLKHNILWESDFNLYAITYLTSLIIVMIIRLYFNILYLSKV